ncbi:MAG TPA: hypothetical protein VFA15_03585, partial [Nitrososphaera sp.]|nr:hypothetical protein [Nitrososphaera sp.]
MLVGTEKAEIKILRLSQLADQLTINAKGLEAQRCYEEMMRIAEVHGIRNLQRINLQWTSYLLRTGRFREAEEHLDTLNSTRVDRTFRFRRDFYFQKGVIATMRGAALEAYGNFDKAVTFAKSSTDTYNIPPVLINYAHCAEMLGNITLARGCCEEALLIARRNNFGWLIPFICLLYANILSTMGRHESAQGYLVEAANWHAYVPILDCELVATGIPLATRLKDKALLARCVKPEAIEFALSSREPAIVGQVCSAFANLYAEQGQLRKGSSLLQRAL